MKKLAKISAFLLLLSFPAVAVAQTQQPPAFPSTTPKWEVEWGYFYQYFLNMFGDCKDIDPNTPNDNLILVGFSWNLLNKKDSGNGKKICKDLRAFKSHAEAFTGWLVGNDNVIPMWSNGGKSLSGSILRQQVSGWNDPYSTLYINTWNANEVWNMNFNKKTFEIFKNNPNNQPPSGKFIFESNNSGTNLYIWWDKASQRSGGNSITTQNGLSIGVTNSSLWDNFIGPDLSFGGWKHNDPVQLYRVNTGVDNTEFRLRVGDNMGSDTDKFVIGATRAGESGNPFHKKFSFLMNGKMGVGMDNPVDALSVSGSISAGSVDMWWATWPEYGQRIFFEWAKNNSDLLAMYRYNRWQDQTDLRMVVGDNPSGSDRFQIGIAHQNNQSDWNNRYTNLFTPKFTFTSGGKFGIGTENPNANLDVNGSTNLGGNVTISNSGNLSVSGSVIVGGKITSNAPVNVVNDNDFTTKKYVDDRVDENRVEVGEVATTGWNSTVTVKFKTPFKTIPKVVAQPSDFGYWDWCRSDWFLFNVKVSNVTEKWFDIKLLSDGRCGGQMHVYKATWMASINASLVTTEGLSNISQGTDFGNDWINTSGSATGNLIQWTTGNVGIGTNNPTAKLDVVGKFKLTDGTQWNGKVLTSDVNGVASWTNFSDNKCELFWDYNTCYGEGSFKAALERWWRVWWSNWRNTWFWSRTLASFLSGEHNTAIGAHGLQNMSVGNFNTAIGNAVLHNIAVWYNNTGVGGNTLGYFKEGSWNTAIGKDTWVWMERGNNNTLVWFDAWYSNAHSTSLASGDNNIAIGANTLFKDNNWSNQLNIGNTIYGLNIGWSDSKIGIGTNNPTQKFEVAGNILANGYFYTSDARLKNNITPLTNISEKIAKIRGVSFDWKSTSKRTIGLIAQEVEKVFPELVHTDANGYKSVEYGNFVAILIEWFKEQQTKIENLEKQIESQKSDIEYLKREIENIKNSHK